MRAQVLLWSLWLSVILLALWVGGTLYQMLVIVPLWTASPPGSLRAFLAADYPHTVLNFFGPPFIVARTLCLVVALVAGWRSAAHRPALLVALVSWLIVIALTLFLVYPMNDDLFGTGLARLNDGEARDLLQHWIVADRVRFAVGCLGFMALLFAFRLPLPGRQDAQGRR